jgi:hypothetical protein
MRSYLDDLGVVLLAMGWVSVGEGTWASSWHFSDLEEGVQVDWLLSVGVVGV